MCCFFFQPWIQLFFCPSAHLGRTGPEWFCGLSVCVSCPSICLSDTRMCVCVCVCHFMCVMFVRPSAHLGRTGPDWFCGLSVCVSCPSVCLSDMCVCVCVCHVMCVMFVRPSAHLGRTGPFFLVCLIVVCVLCVMTIFCCASIFILCAYAISNSVRPIICSVASFDRHGGQTEHRCNLLWILCIP